MTVMENFALVLDGVTKTYKSRAGSVNALRGITQVFGQASFTAVMGPSGSGKSTLLQCAAGLDRPTSGAVQLGDTDLAKLSEVELTKVRRARMGFVFQAYNLLPSLTVQDNVGLPLRLVGQRPRGRDIAEVLTRVGLDGMLRRRPAELSGGQQQRVAIARALITRPEVLFADEPTGALDSTTSRQVLGLLREATDRLGQTVVMVTHDPVAAAYADRVIFLTDGRLAGSLERGTAQQIAAAMSDLDAERGDLEFGSHGIGRGAA
jgi:putative ABC transport system ATP-binding protein